MQAAQAAPDVRADRVEELRKQVEAGTYRVPTQKLASMLLGM
jgi:flagellar biosynthesis anti-sigma factor FlgM